MPNIASKLVSECTLRDDGSIMDVSNLSLIVNHDIKTNMKTEWKPVTFVTHILLFMISRFQSSRNRHHTYLKDMDNWSKQKRPQYKEWMKLYKDAMCTNNLDVLKYIHKIMSQYSTYVLFDYNKPFDYVIKAVLIIEDYFYHEEQRQPIIHFLASNPKEVGKHYGRELLYKVLNSPMYKDLRINIICNPGNMITRTLNKDERSKVNEEEKFSLQKKRHCIHLFKKLSMGTLEEREYIYHYILPNSDVVYGNVLKST